jgi:uridine kinase
MDRFAVLTELATRISEMGLAHPVCVAIDGVDAAGKTILAEELGSHIKSKNREVIRASIDGFHNPASIRYARGALSPEGYYNDSFNYDALVQHLLLPLGSNGGREYAPRVFDYRTDTAVAHELSVADRDAVLLFDGVFLLRPELREYWDYTVFVDAAFEVTLLRALHRDLPLFGSEKDVRQRYEQRYVPGQKIYLRQCNPKQAADAIVDNNDVAQPSIFFRC